MWCATPCYAIQQPIPVAAKRDLPQPGSAETHSSADILLISHATYFGSRRNHRHQISPTSKAALARSLRPFAVCFAIVIFVFKDLSHSYPELRTLHLRVHMLQCMLVPHLHMDLWACGYSALGRRLKRGGKILHRRSRNSPESLDR